MQARSVDDSVKQSLKFRNVFLRRPRKARNPKVQTCPYIDCQSLLRAKSF